MNNRQTYINRYRDIVSGLGIYGDSAEVLIQLLAEATYISEIETAVYVQEASLEKAVLTNSKIQHCMNDMYSVFRGSCPRVIFKFTPTRYFNLKPFDPMFTGSGFKVYYLGYLKEGLEGVETEPETESVAVTTGFVYSPIVIPPSTDPNVTYTLIGLLAKEEVTYSFKTSTNYDFYVGNTQLDNLSSDMWCKINDVYYPVTRNFSEHIMDRKVFDLTIPDFGSRLYVAGVTGEGPILKSSQDIQTEANLNIKAEWFKYSYLSDYNMSELKKMVIKGTNPVSFEGGEFRSISEAAKGLILIQESSRDTLSTIHYRANRDRYVNSIIRTNSDIGTILEEAYPEYVTTGGTSYKFSSSDSGSSLEIFYVPKVDTNLLRDEDIEDFRNNKRGYFVTDNIKVTPGTKYVAMINIDLELYQSIPVTDEIVEILTEYNRKFNTNLDELSNEIKSLISKISNVKQITSFSIDYILGGSIIDEEGKIDMFDNIDHVYYEINTSINTKVQTTEL